MAYGKDLTTLSPGERFWVDRLRRSQTQAEAAARLGIPERRYLQIENDRRQAAKVPKVKPTAAEMCGLARRRSGRSLEALGALLGVSKVTLLAWEAIGEPRLWAAWERMGYKFTKVN